MLMQTQNQCVKLHLFLKPVCFLTLDVIPVSGIGIIRRMVYPFKSTTTRGIHDHNISGKLMLTRKAVKATKFFLGIYAFMRAIFERIAAV